MNRQQKEAVVSDLRRMISETQATFLVNYKGMSVSALQGLRKNLRTEGSKLKITKATLMRKAAEDLAGSDAFCSELKNQVGLVFADKDVSATAKQLVSFAKDNSALTLLVGFYEAKVLSKQELAFLASLPSREILLAQLFGTMKAPMGGLVTVLYQMIARLLYVLKRIEEQKQQNQ